MYVCICACICMCVYVKGTKAFFSDRFEVEYFDTLNRNSQLLEFNVAERVIDF